MTRVLAGATPEFRAARRASVARLNFFLRLFFIILVAFSSGNFVSSSHDSTIPGAP